jgi:ribosomal-protein-alanine N-acetyltransferase
LSGERVTLRPLTPHDDVLFWKLKTDPVVNCWLEARSWPDVACAREERLRLEAGVETGHWFFWGLSLGARSPLVGTVCLWNFTNDRRRCELGFDLFPTRQGKGLMAEAVGTLLSWAWAELPLGEVGALTHRENLPARNLLVRRGFSEASFPGDGDFSDDERLSHLWYRLVRP